MNSSFVCAAQFSILSHVETTKKRNSDYLDDDKLNSFFKDNCSRFLQSIGISWGKGQAVNSKISNRFGKVIERLRNAPCFNDMEMVIDSGGYSFQQEGYATKKDIDPFMNIYYNDFLPTYKDYYNYSFLFDICPGSSFCVIDSIKEMLDFNVKSYRMASELSDELRKKLFYIFHFRTPAMLEVNKKLMFDYHFADRFDNFSIGGLVSSRGAASPPVILYLIPVNYIVDYAIKRGLNKFRLHILGASDTKEILGHTFFRHHIKKVHNIDVEMTWDSSTIFKILGLSRFCYYLNDMDNSVWKLSFRSNELDIPYLQRREYTNGELFYKLLNDAVTPYGMKRLNLKDNPIYMENKQFNSLAYTYGILYILKYFKVIEQLCEQIVKELYPIYESGNVRVFNNEVSKWMRRFNSGKISNKIDYRINSIYNSLEMLKKLDLNYSDYLVNRYLTVDENEKLMKGGQIIF